MRNKTSGRKRISIPSQYPTEFGLQGSGQASSPYRWTFSRVAKRQPHQGAHQLVQRYQSLGPQDVYLSGVPNSSCERREGVAEREQVYVTRRMMMPETWNHLLRQPKGNTWNDIIAWDKLECERRAISRTLVTCWERGRWRTLARRLETNVRCKWRCSETNARNVQRQMKCPA